MRDVNEAVQDAVALLRVPRSRLGICCSSKGLVGGRLVIHNRRTGGCGGCVVWTVDKSCGAPGLHMASALE